MASSSSAILKHPRWGSCELVRIEGTDWIVRVIATGRFLRVPSERRSEFDTVGAPLPPPIPQPNSPAGNFQRTEERNARCIIESLRIGLPSADGSTRQLAVGYNKTERFIREFLEEVSIGGGAALLLKGQYGQGKTFALTVLEEIAREEGFVTVRTEVDATENRLNKPHHVYRDLVRNLKLPNATETGARAIARKTADLLATVSAKSPYARMQWLEQQLECFPLSWLLSDTQIHNKPELVGLLECDPNYPARIARAQHRLHPPRGPSQWPAFNAGTQGDFASFVLCGIGRLAKLLEYKGLIVLMDEMEKWTELNWAEQSRAGNLLGGLIWGATAEVGRRDFDDHPEVLWHSGRCGGYPFTTSPRCHMGVAVAMTPRGDDGPEWLWSQYGTLRLEDVPALTTQNLKRYCSLVAPTYAQAYAIGAPADAVVQAIASRAMGIWKRDGALTTRAGVQAVIQAFDGWRHES
ncbi:MAG: BREX system ATP-binding domain-containing protein [Planctomycetaceae bacterium]